MPSLEHIKSDSMREILKIQSTILKSIHNFMQEREIINILPVILSSITDPLGPDPATELVKQPSIKYNGQELVLCQSMIFHKQLALLTGVNGIYTISPNIRLEDPRRGSSGRHLFEFCQVDFELARIGMNQTIEFIEKLFTRIFGDVRAQCGRVMEKFKRVLPSPSPPFPRFTTHDVKREYGTEWEEELSADMEGFFWVTCHDREFYDKEDPENPGHFKNYDLIYPNGYGEALSGGEREYKYTRIVKRLREDNIPLEQYENLLNAAKEGLVPSTGAGFGVGRLLRFITGKKEIREVKLFPKVPGDPVYF